MNRRDFLLSTTGLALAPAIVRGQAISASGTASNDAVLEDFESGTFTGWTFTGNCWGKAPTAASRYRDRITNYQGNYYLLSAPTGTGTATSPEYTVNKPYLKFKVAGGSSRDTRVEILVDGKVDRWVAGADSLDFEDVCIDIAHLQGKKLTVKVIDNSTDKQWGMVLVDNFRLSNAPLRRYAWIPEDFGVQSEFILYSQFLSSKEERRAGKHLPVGISPGQLDYAVNEVYKRMIRVDMDHIPRRSTDELSKLIAAGVDETVKRLGIQDKPILLRKYLYAWAVSVWVSTHVIYDANFEAIANQPTTAYRDRFHRFLPETTLGFNPPTAICSGFSRLTTDLLNLLGVNARHLGGERKWFGSKAVGNETSGFVFVDFGNGFKTFTDPTTAETALAQARRYNGVHNSDVILPISPATLELFMCRYYPLKEIGQINPERTSVEEHETPEFAESLTRMSYIDWQKIDTSKLVPLQGSLLELRNRVFSSHYSLRGGAHVRQKVPGCPVGRTTSRTRSHRSLQQALTTRTQPGQDPAPG